jgi:hypothetical protein
MTRAQTVLPIVAVIALAALAVIAVRPIVNPPAAAPHQTAATPSGGGGPLAAVSGQLRGLKATMTAVPRSLVEVVRLLRELVVALTYTHCSSGSEPRSVPPGEEC